MSMLSERIFRYLLEVASLGTSESAEVLEIGIGEEQPAHILEGALPEYGQGKLETEECMHGVRLPAEPPEKRRGCKTTGVCGRVLCIKLVFLLIFLLVN